MNKKIYIITILVIIVTTLSQTVSFISGDHQFYQNVQDKCTKCHGDIGAQLLTSTNHSSSSCNFCHVKSATNHTNTNPSCQDCHNTTQKLNDSLEAHTDFSSMDSKGCIACHTTYNTLVNYSRAEYIDYTITNKYGNWVISNITTIGTLNLSYNAQRKGGDHDIQNVSCKDCHEDIFEAVSLGGHAVVLAKNSTNITNGTQVPYHNNSNTTLEAWCRTCHSRADANFSTQQHSVRKTTCEECHQAYNSTPHPGNFFANINTVPHLYRSLVCISCHSIGWPAPNGGIHFKVHQEPYFDVTYEIIEPLLITNSTPANDPTTTAGTAQAFSITLNRPADIYWYNDGSEIFRALSVISSSYTSSNTDAGVYNITAVADDGSTMVSKTWNWTVTNQTGNGTGGGGGGGGIVPGGGIITGSATGPSGSNNISGYVFDNYILALPGVLVQNGGYQNTTNISGYYSITDLPNGTYTFSYSKAGFDTNYSIFTLNGASVENVNVMVYDTTPPASVSNINTAGGNFYINNSWTNPTDADFNYTWFRYGNGTTLQNTNKSTNYLNLTWSPHYVQNISAQTVDNYNNINQTLIWFNATVPDNPPIQAPIGNKTADEGQLLTFTVNATDADNDTITYGTNATKGTFNTTTGNFSWVPNYGDAGFYLLNFNSSDGYGGIANENVAVTVINVPLSITNASPTTDPTTIIGSSQTFSIALNRTADIIWYNNGSEAFRALNVTSATYINSSAAIGTYNITAFANDSYDSALRTWNWTVIPNINGTNVSGGGDGGGGSGGSNNSISGYVFDNFGLSLGGVIVQNGSYQNTTDASGYYSIANLSNGTYNFSYSKAGFGTAYFEFTLNGAVIMNANRTLYDNMSAAPVSNPSMTTGNFYVNNTWINPTDADFNYIWFRYSNDTTLQNISKPVNYLNLTWQPHYTQNISAQTVDTSGNVNQTKVWFNTTIPNNAPFQYAIGNKVVNENENLQFNVTATDADNDTITYGTNATKGTFNTTTGNFSWTPAYGDAGFYYWNFNSSDGYGGVATENVTITVNNVPLSITSFSPLSDSSTELGTMQNFSVALNRTANVTWYMNGTMVQTNISVISANYTNSTAGIGKWNVTASATDNIDTIAKTWNWTIVPQATYNVSGYVFDNYGSGLNGVLVQNGSFQNTTVPSGNYLITGLVNGTYNFSYSKAGFNTDYLEVTINGADNTSANKTLYDTTPSASVSNPVMITGNFYINNTWTNPADADYNYAWFRYSNGTTITNVSKPTDYLNLTWQPHYTQNISVQTVDTYGNVNQTKVWFNTTIPNNVPVLSQIGNKTADEGQWLNFTISANDPDSDVVIYGTNATKGAFNTTTGSFSWLTTYSDAGTYAWYFNSSDGYSGVATESIVVTVNNTPLSIASFFPLSDPATELGAVQSFSVALNRTANITWYIDSTQIQTSTNTTSANYTNSTAGIGVHNVTALASDGYDSVSKAWNWTVTTQSVYNVSGYVFDNYGSGLDGVLVQNGSSQNTTVASGYYLITGLINGTYNFSYSKAGFNTNYLDVTVNGADNISANKTLYDISPSASVSAPATATGNFYVNNTWTNPADADYSYAWFKYSNGNTLQNVSSPVNYLNLTWPPHYTQNISAQTMDTYGNINQTEVWFNATIPNNPPVQSSIGNKTINENQTLQFNVTATDVDNDTITYGTNATRGTFNTTTGQFSWTPGYGDAGVYVWDFNSNDGYGGVASETITVTVGNAPLSIMSSSPTGDPTTTVGTPQTFGITLNRIANVTWYINGSAVQTNSSVMLADYTNSTASIGKYNVTAIANDNYYSASRTWNWTVIEQPTYNVSGYVFDNHGSVLGGVLVQNGSNQNTTLVSGYYLISGLLNGSYNFSLSKSGFNTGYLEVTLNGTDITSANKTIYDNIPPASVSNPASATGNFYINNTWVNPTDVDFNYTWFRYSNGTDLLNISSSVSYLNLTWSPHYTQNISAQTVDTYGNINQTEVWFNATIPNNPPVQLPIGNRNVIAGSLLQFNVTATDVDSDQVTYGTNATNGTLNSTTGVYSWQTGSSDVGTYTWYFNSSDSYGGVASETITVTMTMAPPSKYIPPAPSNLTSTQGNFWINNSWQAGAGNTTDSYNVSVNGSWMNGTTNTYYNNTVGPHGWSNITVWAYNNSDNGSLSSASVSQSTQVANSAPLQTAIGNKSVDGGQWLNFTVNADDVDNDTIIYGTNATKGSFDITTGNFSWLTTYSDVGTYIWYFNSSDGYGGVASETITVTVNNTPLSVTSFSPPSDPTTTQGTAQTFNIVLNRTANVTWYMNGTQVQSNTSVTSASYTNSTAGIGNYNITTIANDSYDSALRTWNWTVIAQPTYNINGYVYDNYGTGLGGVLVQNGSYQNTTLASGYYLITGLFNGTYNFSYSKAGFNTGYLEITINGVDNTSANKNLYDTTQSASVSNPAMIAGNFYINNTWTNPVDADYNYAWFRYSNGTTITNVSKPTDYLNLTWQPHYNQNISAQTVDNYSNINQTIVWFNATIPNNPPVQSLIGNRTVTAGSLLQFNVTSTDADSDPVTYGTDATKGNLNSTTGAYSWQTSSSDVGTYTWYFNSSDSYGGVASETIAVTVTAAPPSKYIPPAPSNLTSTQGNFWINNSWQAGAGNVTDSYNVSVNGTWTNGTTNTYYNNTVGPHGWSNITVWAYNNSDNGSLSSAPVSQSTQVANNAPLQASIGNKVVNEGDLLAFTVSATDADNDAIIYGTNATKGSFNTTTGNFSWTPGYGDAGVYVWYFNSSDGYSGAASETIAVTVNNVPLLITSSSPVSDPAIMAGTAQTFGITLNRTANVTWYISNSTVQTDSSIASANYTNSTAEVGTYNVTVAATDGYDSASKQWNWTVVPQPVYAPGIISWSNSKTNNNSPTLTVNTSEPVNFNATANQTITTWNWYQDDVNQNNNNNNFTTSWSTSGTKIIQVNATNSNGTSNTITWTVIAQTAAYIPPTPANINSTTGDFWANTTWQAGAGNTTDSYNVSVNGIWTNGTTNTSVNSSLSAHSWQNVTVYAYNASGGGSLSTSSAMQNTQIPDNPPAQSPIGAKSVDEGQWLNFTVHATDADNDAITYGTNATKGSLDTTTGNFSWLTTYSDSGTYVWYFNSGDGYGGVASETITVTVNNTPLSVTSFSPLSDPTTMQGTAQTFNITLNRIANITWYMNGLQVQADTSTTSASYTNSTAGIGTWNVTASATDGIDTVSRTWNWTVNAMPPAAYIPPNPTNLQSTTGNFWVNNTWLPGTGNTTDSYNVSVNEAWHNGITNTYYNNTVGPHGWSNITVWAYNSSGAGSFSAGSISQNTQVPNNPPVQVQIGNKNVTAGDLLTFTVSTTDADNDTITYGTNATIGTLNPATGVYSWQTTSSDVGTYIWYFNSSDGYGGVASETIIVTVNNTPLSIISSSPVSDPTTTVGVAQAFSIALNRTANVTWYINGSTVQTNSSIVSADYTNSTAGVGVYNVTAIASDGLESASGIWNWTIISQPTYNVSGYVFDNYGPGLGGVLVQNGSYQSNTSASGYYLITGLLNGTYNLSYSKEGFNTGYLEVTINGADNTAANTTIYDTTPPASASNLAATSAPTYINWTWIDPPEPDFDHVEAYVDGTFMSNITRGMQFYNASYFMPNSTHTISTRTVDIYGNVNTTWANNTATTLPDYTYVSSFQNDTGTVSDFVNALNASDGGASATFTEALVGGTYQLNVTTNTTDIPDAGIHTLQLMYNVSGGNFTLQIWNGTAWNNRATLNDTSLSYRNITLMPEELVSEGASAGNAGSTSRYYALVRYLDLNASAAQQGTLYLDYQRVYSE
jgi:hypothetical protein